MSTTKKILGFICLLFLSLAIVSCGGGLPGASTDAFTKSDAEAELQLAGDRLEFTTTELLNWKQNFDFIESNLAAPHVTFAWEVVKVTNLEGTEVENIYVAEDGKVTLPVYGTGDVLATIKVVMTCEYDHTDTGVYKLGEVSAEKEWTFTIKEAEQVKTIKTLIDENAALGAKFPVDGISFSVENAQVVAKLYNNEGWFINDGTAGLYVFSTEENLQVGDIVNISGTLTTYYSIFEAKDVKIDVIGHEDITFEAEETSVSDIIKNVYTAKAGDNTVMRSGSYIFEIYAKLTCEDGYYYLYDPYTGERVIIYYKSGFDYVPFEGTAETYDDVLTPYVNQYINITVVYYDYKSGVGFDYHRFILSTFPIELAGAPTLTDAQKVDITKTTLAGSFGSSVSQGDTLVLPVEDAETGCAISWACSFAGLDLTTGVVGEVTAPVEGTLTATITCGAVVEELVINITFNPLYSIVHAGTEADPYSVRDFLLATEALENKEWLEEMVWLKGEVESASYDSSYGNWTIYLVSPNAEKTVEIFAGVDGENFPNYKVNASLLVGKTIVAYGYVQRYNSTYELAKKTVGTSTVYPILVEVANDGSEATPFTVAEAVWEMGDFVNGTISAAEMSVTGVVTTSSYNTKYSSYTMSVKCPEGASYSFKFYSCVMGESIIGDYTAADALVGCTVTVKGYMTLYVDGENYIYEVAYFKADKSPTGENVSPVITKIVSALTDAEKVAAAKAEVEKMTLEYKGGQTVALATSFKDGATATWGFPEGKSTTSINLETGILVDVTADETIELVCSLSSGEVSEDVTITITVKVAVIKKTIAELETIAATVEQGKTTEQIYEVKVILGSIDSTKYGNAHIFGSSLVTYGMYDAAGNRYDAMTEKPVEGDVVVLQAAIKNYGGALQLQNAVVVSIIHPTAATLTEAETIIDASENKVISSEWYLMEFVLGAITSTNYGNANIADSTLIVYGMYTINGTKYTDMAEKPIEGAKVKVICQLEKYDTKKEIVNSILVEFENPTSDAEKVASAKEALTIDSEVKEGATLTLPATQGYATITWSSSNAEVLSNAGVSVEVTEDTKVTMTATITYGEASDTKVFEVTVKNQAGGAALFSTDFGAVQCSGFAEKEETRTLKDSEGKAVGTVKTWACQIGSQSGKFNESAGMMAVLCATRKSTSSGLAYVQFDVKGATSITFNAAMWGGDSAGISKFTSFGVSYSTDGTTWTEITLDKSLLSDTAWKEFTASWTTKANYVRIFQTAPANSTTSNINTRLTVDEVVIK